MDFVPKPLRSDSPPVDVPLLDVIPYEVPQANYNFETFPEYHGFDLPIESTISPVALATFIQSWLFFGLLAEYLGHTPELTQLSALRCIKGRTIRCVCIDEIARSRFTDEFRGRLADKELDFGAKLSIAEIQIKALECLDAAKFSPVPEVAMSVRILIDVLDTLSALSVPGQPYTQRTASGTLGDLLTWDCALPSLQILLHRLKDNGWCPSIIPGLCLKFGYIHLYYMSQIRRCHPLGLNHQNCSGSICNAIGLRTDPFDRPRHYRTGCSCCLLRVPMDKIIATLRQGKTPLVRASRDSSGQLSLDIVPAKSSSRYIAVSHVWSDGLGNAVENSAFSCQLERIIQSLSRLPYFGEGTISGSWFERFFRNANIPSVALPRRRMQSYLFWLDILCIPTRSIPGINVMDLRNLRRVAVAQIPVVYAGAAQVLILDSEIETLRIGASQMTENVAQILGCNWATRAWTYQEGAHSLKCSIQFSDGVLDPRDDNADNRGMEAFIYQRSYPVQLALMAFPPSLDEDQTRDIRGLLEKYLLRDFTWALYLWFPKLDETYQAEYYSGTSAEARTMVFIRTWNELQTRSCTDPSDQVTILAMALQLPLREIISIPSHERLKSIIWSLHYIPLSFLLVPHDSEHAQLEQHDLWVPDGFNGLISDPLYDLKGGTNLKFSAAKDRITFPFLKDTIFGDPFLIAISQPLRKVSWLRLDYDTKKYLIRFRRSSNNTLDTSSFHGALFVIDPNTFASENREFKDTWISGCCLLVQNVKKSANQQELLEWDLDVVYDSAISVLLLEDGTERISEVPESLMQEAIAHLSTEKAPSCQISEGSWGDSEAINIHMACNPPTKLTSPLKRYYLFNVGSFGWISLTSGGIVALGCILPSTISLVITNIQTGYSVHHPIIKAAFIMWYIPVGMLFLGPHILSGVGFAIVFIIGLWTGEDIDYVRVKILKSLLEGTHLGIAAFWLICALLGLLLVSLPILGPLLFIIGHQKSGEPYSRSDAAFVAFTSIACLSLILTVISGALWAKVSRRLWLASYSPVGLQSSPPKTIFDRAAWRKVFTDGDWVVNILVIFGFDSLLENIISFYNTFLNVKRPAVV